MEYSYRKSFVHLYSFFQSFFLNFATSRKIMLKDEKGREIQPYIGILQT